MWFRPTWSSVEWSASLADAALHIPPEWVAAAEHVRRHAVRRVLVLGARDAGKSTLCRFLAEFSARSGTSTALLDTDVGQTMIGPPACVTMSDAHGLSLAFVGTTNPVLGWRRLIEGTRRLGLRTEADLLIVNTGGLLAGPGRRLKRAKIDALLPDLLIALGEDPALEAVCGGQPTLQVLRLPSSPDARRKTDGERRAARRKAFRGYFSEAAILRLDRRMVHPMEADTPLPTGLLVGLSDGEGNDLGLGLLKGADGETLAVLSPIDGSTVARVTPGVVRLDEKFAEASARPEPQGSSPMSPA